MQDGYRLSIQESNQPPSFVVAQAADRWFPAMVSAESASQSSAPEARSNDRNWLKESSPLCRPSYPSEQASLAAVKISPLRCGQLGWDTCGTVATEGNHPLPSL